MAYPGVKELLQSLPPYRWTVVTSASEAIMRERPGSPSRVASWPGDHAARSKPDPECYLCGAGLLSRDPAECVVIEDAPAGVKAGKRAGCRIIAILSSHSPDELQEAIGLYCRSAESRLRPIIPQHSNFVSGSRPLLTEP